MRFVKLQGTGNDFVLVDARAWETDWPELARQLCERHFGIGADGLLVLLDSQQADYRMRIFNPDGSEAEMCGNGIRCFARYLLSAGLVPPTAGGVRIETLAGVRDVRFLGNGERVEAFQVSMGAPRLRPRDIPVALDHPGPVVDYPLSVDGHELRLTFVSMGNPHAVAFIEQPVAEFPLEQVGPLVEHHPLFPQRVNFSVARIIGPGRLEARVWERGAGPTMACGTGACAVAVAGRLRGKTPFQVDIALPGGTLRILWDGTEEVLLTGPAELVFVGEWTKGVIGEGL